MIQYRKRELLILLQSLSDDDFICFNSLSDDGEFIIRDTIPYITEDFPNKNVERKGIEFRLEKIKNN